MMTRVGYERFCGRPRIQHGRGLVFLKLEVRKEADGTEN